VYDVVPWLCRKHRLLTESGTEDLGNDKTGCGAIIINPICVYAL